MFSLLKKRKETDSNFSQDLTRLFYTRFCFNIYIYMTQIPTFNVFLKNIYRIKTHNLFKLANIFLLFRSFINVK